MTIEIILDIFNTFLYNLFNIINLITPYIMIIGIICFFIDYKTFKNKKILDKIIIIPFLYICWILIFFMEEITKGRFYM